MMALCALAVHRLMHGELRKEYIAILPDKVYPINQILVAMCFSGDENLREALACIALSIYFRNCDESALTVT